jgi:hypothetical protein
MLEMVAELYERFDTDTNHLGRLTKLKQSRIVEDFIVDTFWIKGISDAFF